MSIGNIEKVAAALGVAVGEKFRLRGANGKLKEADYRYSENNGLEVYADMGWTLCNITDEILRGVYEVVYVPKPGDTYYTYYGKDWAIKATDFIGSAEDYARLNNSMVYRTEADAADARPRVFAQITGKRYEVMTWRQSG